MNLFVNFTYTQEMFLDLVVKGLRIVEVPIEVRYFDGRRYRVARNLLTYALRISRIIFAAYSDYRPLIFFGVIGALVFLVGFILDSVLGIHFLMTGTFTPYKSFGFTGGFLNIVGLGIVILGLVADMLVRIRMNQEKLLYYERRRTYSR